MLTIQVRLQTRSSNGPASVKSVTTAILQTEGLRGFYAGLSASLLRQLTYATVRFATYEELKRRYTSDNPSLPRLISIGTLAGLLGGIAGNPADVLNVRMQRDAGLPPDRRRNYQNALSGLVRMGREEGVRSWMTGWLPNAARASVHTAGQLVSYDIAKAGLMKYLEVGDTVGTQLTASFMAGVVAATVTNPIDVVKTQVMAGGVRRSVIQVMGRLMRSDGIRWVFRGWVPSFLRLGP